MRKKRKGKSSRSNKSTVVSVFLHACLAIAPSTDTTAVEIICSRMIRACRLHKEHIQHSQRGNHQSHCVLNSIICLLS
jgi:hypothetical protein